GPARSGAKLCSTRSVALTRSPCSPSLSEQPELPVLARRTTSGFATALESRESPTHVHGRQYSDDLAALRDDGAAVLVLRHLGGHLSHQGVRSDRVAVLTHRVLRLLRCR